MSRLTELLWRQRDASLPVPAPVPAVMRLNSMPPMVFAEYANRANLFTPEEEVVWEAFVSMVVSAKSRLGGGIFKVILENYL